MAALFSEFPGVSKSEWLSKVEKDLKGKPFSDLQWHLGPEIKLDPLFTPEDFESFGAPIPKAETNWLIGESIEAHDYTLANKTLLEALNGGVTAPEIVLQSTPSKTQWSDLFKGVKLEMIHLQFDSSPELDWISIINSFLNFIQATKIDSNKIRGTFKLPWGTQKELLTKEPDLLKNWEKTLNGFTFFQIDGRAHCKGHEQSISELEVLAKQTSELFSLLQEANVQSDKLQFTIAIGTSYFVEIAKIRALKLICGNLQKAHQRPLNVPFIDCYFSLDAMTPDSDLNMIRNTTQAMSAIIGGADRLTVAPSNSKSETANSFTKRIARNVQHLLHLESNFGKVNDPAAGSYYLEKLTTLFGETTWKKLA